MNKIRRKILIKRLSYILYNILLLTIAYIFNRFFQMLIFILFYNTVQNCFNYRFHAESIIQNDPVKSVKCCKIITIVVEILYLIFCKELNVSVYSNLFIILIIVVINSLLQYYCERTVINKNILSNKNHVIGICKEYNISEAATNRLILHYVDNKTISEIASIECVEEHTIKQSLRRTKRKLGL